MGSPIPSLEEGAWTCKGSRLVGTMIEHGYVTLPSWSVGAVLGDLDVSTNAAWSTGHSAIHFLVTWSEESFSSMIDSVDG